jgi:hypothetical protein
VLSISERLRRMADEANVERQAGYPEEVPDAEGALLRVEGELEVALLQGLPVAVAEEGHDLAEVGDEASAEVLSISERLRRMADEANVERQAGYSSAG